MKKAVNWFLAFLLTGTLAFFGITWAFRQAVAPALKDGGTPVTEAVREKEMEQIRGKVQELGSIYGFDAEWALKKITPEVLEELNVQSAAWWNTLLTEGVSAEEPQWNTETIREQLSMDPSFVGNDSEEAADRKIMQAEAAIRQAVVRTVLPMREAAKIKQSTAAKDLKKQIVKAKKRSAELDGLIKKLYESYATGKITESRFDMLIADYEREQAQINELIGTEEEQLTVYAEDTERIEDFLALARKYTDFTELTPQMIYEFIDKIVVHKGERIDDERTQEVEIFLKYIGKFDVPLPDPTPEEIAAQEKKKRQRAMHREYARKSRARKKAETEAARLQAEASEK